MATQVCRRTDCANVHGDDPMAVVRMIDGHPPELVHKLDLQAAIDYLTVRGFSEEEIAARVGATSRTVGRRRAMAKAMAA